MIGYIPVQTPEDLLALKAALKRANADAIKDGVSFETLTKLEASMGVLSENYLRQQQKAFREAQKAHRKRSHIERLITAFTNRRLELGI